MKFLLRKRIYRAVLCLALFVMMIPSAASGTSAETRSNLNYPTTIQEGAIQAWTAVCNEFGEATVVEYGGELYLDEGDGAALPLLCYAEETYFLVVVVQQGEILTLIVYRIDGDGQYKQVFVDPVLTLGDRAALFLYAHSGSALITEASVEDDISVIAAAVPNTVEKRSFQGDETADSIAGMGVVPWEAFQALYGDPEWTIRIDANYGLFHLQIKDTQTMQSLFDIQIP